MVKEAIENSLMSSVVEHTILDSKPSDMEGSVTVKVSKNDNSYAEMVQNQGGDISYLENTNKFEKAKFIEPIKAEKSGYIQEINAEEVGKVACNLGAGRIRKEDEIDYTVGIKLCKKVSENVSKGEDLAYIYANDIEKLEIAKQKLNNIIKIDKDKIEQKPTIFGICK